VCVRARCAAWHAPERLSILIAILTLALLVLVVLLVSAPLRAARRAEAEAAGAQPEVAASAPHPQAASEELQAVREELQAAREAKYRDIRDAELDYRTGKLSTEDYQAIDAALRAEAIEILNQLEADGAEAIRPRGA
jgi:hypothetical protein